MSAFEASVLGGLACCEAVMSLENMGIGVDNNVKGQDGAFWARECVVPEEGA